MTELEPILLSLFRKLPSGVVLWRLEEPANDGSLRLVDANVAAETQLGIRLSLSKGETMRDLFPFWGADRRKIYADAVRSGIPKIFSENMFAEDHVTTNIVNVTAMPLGAQVVAGLFEAPAVRAAHDESNRRMNKFMNAILENMPAMVFVKDARDLRFELFNRSGERLLGVAREDMIGKTDLDFFPLEQAEFFQNKDREVLRDGGIHEIAEEPIDTAKGRRWLHTKKVSIMSDHGVPEHLLGISVDITEQRLAQQEVERQRQLIETIAITDELTGLHNRRGFMKLAEQYARVAVRRATPFAIMFVDLDGLKTINDHLGHAAGDAALRRVAAAIQSSVRGADIMARLGGDEFVILIDDATEEKVAIVGERIQHRLAEDGPSGEGASPLTVSIGSAFHTPGWPKSIEDLLSEADQNMYVEKRGGGIRGVVSPAIVANADSELPHKRKA